MYGFGAQIMARLALPSSFWMTDAKFPLTCRSFLQSIDRRKQRLKVGIFARPQAGIADHALPPGRNHAIVRTCRAS